MPDSQPEDLINALQRLEEDSMPQWGVMSAPQMLRHCNLQISLYSREKPSGLSSVLRTYTMGRLHLMYVKYHVRYDINRYKKNAYSLPALKTSHLHGVDFEQERKALVDRLIAVSKYDGGMRYTPLHGWVSQTTFKRNILVHVKYHLNQFGAWRN